MLQQVEKQALRNKVQMLGTGWTVPFPYVTMWVGYYFVGLSDFALQRDQNIEFSTHTCHSTTMICSEWGSRAHSDLDLNANGMNAFILYGSSFKDRSEGPKDERPSHMNTVFFLTVHFPLDFFFSVQFTSLCYAPQFNKL